MIDLLWMFGRTPLIGVALGLWVGLAACQPEDNATAAHRHYDRAVAELQAGNPNVAWIEVRNALQRDPDNLAARLLIGRMHLGAGDAAQAETHLRRVHNAQPDTQTELLLARALLMLGRHQDVLQVASGDSGTPEEIAQRALYRTEAHLGLGQFDQAEQGFNAILANQPSSRAARYGLARVMVGRGDLDAARERLTPLVADESGFRQGWMLLGEIHRRQNRPVDALSALDRAETIAADDTLWLMRAQILLSTGDIERARENIDRALARNGNNTQARYLLAVIEFTSGNYTAAKEAFLRVEDQLRDQPQAMLLGAMIRYRTEELAQAELGLRRYLSVEPANHEVRQFLATLLLRGGRPREALDALQPLMAARPDEVAVLELAASAYNRLGDLNRAAEIFQRIAASGDRPLRQRAETMLSLLGVGGESDPMLEEALSDDLSRGIVLVLDYLRTNEVAAARAAIAPLRLAHPDNPIVLNLDGGVALAEGNQDQARRNFEDAVRLDPSFAPAADNLDRLDLAQGNRPAVEQRLRSRLAAAPDDERSIIRLAAFLLGDQRGDEAVRILEEARARLPQSAPILGQVIALRLSRDESAEAAALVDQILESGVDDPAILGLLGGALQQLGNPRRAVEVYRRLAEQRGDSIEAQLQLARALILAEQPDEGRRILDSARALDPEDERPVLALIEVALRQGDTERAIELARSLGNRDQVAAGRLQAALMQQSQRPAEAVPILARLLQEAPSSDIAMQLFFARGRAGQQAEAIGGLRDWLRSNPGDDRIRQLLATTLLTTGDYGGAVEEYQQLLTRNENDAAVLNNLAWALDQLGRPEALDYARRAHALAPESAAITDTLGWLQVRSGQIAEGVVLLERATQQEPENFDMQYHLAYALHQAGRGDEARAILDRILAADQAFSRSAEAQRLADQLRK